MLTTLVIFGFLVVGGIAVVLVCTTHDARMARRAVRNVDAELRELTGSHR